jgi:hypothetical protein
MPENEVDIRNRFEISPALIVGLGGTGYKTVIKVKKRLTAAYRELDLPVRFLVLDLDDRVQPDIELAEQQLLGPTEFHRLAVDAMVLDALEVHKELHWFPAEHQVKPESGERGAGMIRPWGRLALFRSANHVISAINTALDEILSAPAHIALGSQNITVRQDIHIYVVGSLCGGTGGGIFIDIPYLIRSYFHQRGASSKARVYGLLGMPDIFHLEADKTTRIQANAYAALKELDFLMDINNFTDNEMTQIAYGGANKATWGTQRSPYSHVYLCNSSGDNAQGMLTATSDVAELMAEFIFQMSISRMSALIHSANIVNTLADVRRVESSAGALYPAYSGFGVASLSFPSPDIAEYCRYRLADDILDQLLYANTAEGFFQEQLKSFKAQIEENRCLALPTITLEPLNYAQLTHGELVSGLETWYNGVKEGRRCVYDADQIHKSEQRFEDLLQARVNSLLDSTDYGFEFTRIFLERLRGAFEKTRVKLNI